MDRKRCTELFYRLVYPSHPNEWEIDEVMARIATLEPARQDLLFDQVSAIWPVSHSLCLAFLEEGARLVTEVPPQLVPEWVRRILGRYESGGLARAREIISKVDELFLRPFYSRNKVSFEQISARMSLYVRGISGQHLELQPGPVLYTDTQRLHVPQSLSCFSEYRQNVLFYKFLVSLHWGFIRQKTLYAEPAAEEIDLVKNRYSIVREDSAEPAMIRYFNLFPDPTLAADLFFLLEMKQVMIWMNEELPGLTRQVGKLCGCLDSNLLEPAGETSRAVARHGAAILAGRSPGVDGFAGVLPDGIEEEPPSVPPSTQRLVQAYDIFSQPGGEYIRPPLLELLGVHDFRRATVAIEKKREAVKTAFVMHLSQLLESEKAREKIDLGTTARQEHDQALVVVTQALDEPGRSENTITIDNEAGELPEELRRLMAEIERDLGQVPDSYFSAAAGMAGNGRSRTNGSESSPEGGSLTGAQLFDEWDYRRSGYRRDWCRLYEKEIPLVRSSFVPKTLAKHKGLLGRIQRQFEMMLLTEQFVGRQRDGDDFDLDAVVEAYGDHRAGAVASDQLFVRLHRNNRDIVTLFLVDMSNSTEGWVGSVIKESLVLLCEAMEIIGDAYGIYGFSGMRRTRCEIFPIKDPAEPFSAVIPQRIGSIMPREYTRLGPAIRYGARRLFQCDARTRLLVTITDGKPEDYDDYKGDYAIEDTRKALMEARGSGLQTFCITVDRQSHDYLPHMYGSGNYVFVDDIQKLPLRLVDMYRMLTS